MPYFSFWTKPSLSLRDSIERDLPAPDNMVKSLRKIRHAKLDSQHQAHSVGSVLTLLLDAISLRRKGLSHHSCASWQHIIQLFHTKWFNHVANPSLLLLTAFPHSPTFHFQLPQHCLLHCKSQIGLNLIKRSRCITSGRKQKISVWHKGLLFVTRLWNVINFAKPCQWMPFKLTRCAREGDASSFSKRTAWCLLTLICAAPWVSNKIMSLWMATKNRLFSAELLHMQWQKGLFAWWWCSFLGECVLIYLFIYLCGVCVCS